VTDPRWPRAADWLAGGPGADPSAPADLAVLGVPTSATSLSPTSAHTTPAAVRAALARFSTYATSRGIDLANRLRPVDLGDLATPDDDEPAVSAAVAAALERARLAVLLGGDNALTFPAAIGALSTALAGTAGLVTVDAHHDLREGRSNGSPVRRLLAAGLSGRRIAQVGIADWANSASYAADAWAAGITVISRRSVAGHGIDASMAAALNVAGAAGGPIYVDLDVDVCDRAVAPACPASRPGGLSASELLQAAYLAGRDPRVVAVDLTEVDAARDAADQRTVRLVALAVLEIAAGLADRAPTPSRGSR
jgi:formiminoglutamase